MKRISLFLMITTLLITGVSISVYAEESTVTVIVDGRVIEFSDAPAYVDKNGRTQVPSRFIGESLGAHVEWNPDLHGVSFTRLSALFDDGNTANIYFHINGKYFYTRYGTQGSHEVRPMDTEAVIVQGRSYIPVRFLAETLGASVDWEDNSGQITVTINSKTKTVGDFIIPQSYVDDVRIVNNEEAMGVDFTLDFFEGLNYGKNSFENRKLMLFHILAQKLDNNTLDELSEFIDSYYKYTPKDSFDNQEKMHFDIENNWHISAVRWALGGFSFMVYDKDFSPGKNNGNGGLE